MLLWLGHAGEVCLFLCLGAGVCAGVWRLLAAGGGGEEMEVMGIIGAVEQERRWRVHVGERRKGGSGRVVLILVLILLLAEGMCMYVWLSRPRVSLVSPGIVTATGGISSWKLALALDEFNCSIALTYLADPKASPRVSVC